MNNETIIQRGSRAVVITEQGNLVWANFYVNAADGIAHATITPTRWQGKTVAGAKRWAEKKLAA